MAVKARRCKNNERNQKRSLIHNISSSEFQVFFKIPPISLFYWAMAELSISGWCHSLWSERTSFLPIFAAAWKVMPRKRDDVRVSFLLFFIHLFKGGPIHHPDTEPLGGTECWEGTQVYIRKLSLSHSTSKKFRQELYLLSRAKSRCKDTKHLRSLGSW